MENQLPDFIIASLYKDSLVIADEKTAIQNKTQIKNKTANSGTTHTPQNKKWFLGDNKKNIVILVNDNAAVFINEEWLETLTKLLNACKLNVGDVAVINFLQHQITFNDLKQQLQPQYVLMFDVTTKNIELPFTMPHYQLQQHSGCNFITAPAITLSTNNTDETIRNEKKKLWEKLKQLSTFAA